MNQLNRLDKKFKECVEINAEIDLLKARKKELFEEIKDLREIYPIYAIQYKTGILGTGATYMMELFTSKDIAEAYMASMDRKLENATFEIVEYPKDYIISDNTMDFLVKSSNGK